MWPFEVKSSKHILEFAHAQMQFFSTPTLSTTLLLAWSQTWSGTSEIEDFFRGTGLEAPKQIGARLRRSGSAASKGGSPSSPAVGRVPIPKPRQSRPKGAPPPPIAPRPSERLSIQPMQQLPSDSTNLWSFFISSSFLFSKILNF